MGRYQWKHLNKQQLGRFYEQHVQMEMAMRGFELYPPAVDDHGVDLVARWPKSPFFEVQIKAIRSPGYLFVLKKYFEPHPGLYLAVGLHLEGQEPVSLLIPSMVWQNTANDVLLTAVFCENDYTRLKSAPEYGVRLNASRFDALHQRFGLDAMLQGMAHPTTSAPTVLSAHPAPSPSSADHEIDPRFVRTIFCDASVFSGEPGAYLAQQKGFTEEQANLALAIHGSDLYPAQSSESAEIANALMAAGVAQWQGNSEGPLVFSSKVLYLLERYGKDVPWFIALWKAGLSNG